MTLSRRGCAERGNLRRRCEPNDSSRGPARVRVGKRRQGTERPVVARKSPTKGWSEGAVFKEVGTLCQPATGGADEPATVETVLYFQARRAGSMETGESQSRGCRCR